MHCHFHDRIAPVLAAALMTAVAAAPANGEKLTIDRIYSDPSIDGPRMRELEFSPDGTRVTFLRGKQEDSNTTDLWEFHIADGEARLLVDSADLIEGEEKLSHEEILRRTTQRISDQRGIVAYEWSKDGKALLFPLNGEIYYYALDDSDNGVRRLTETEAGEFDIQFSPKGTYASFIRGQDLYAINIGTGEEIRLTFDGEGTVKNGVAEFVAQEEMSRHTGYWWSDDELFIAFAQIDESPVEARARYEVNGEDALIIENERYPRAGSANVLIRIGVVTVESGLITWIDLGEEADIYVPRVDWLPDSKTVAIQRQSRDQKVLDLLFADARSGQARLVLHETSPTWINLNDDLYFLDDSEQFVWSSERSGYKHFYLYGNDGSLVRQLTGGAWVANRLLEVDERQRLIYFEGNVESPLERHLYKAGLDDGSDTGVTRITRREGWHGIEIDETRAYYIDRFSSVARPPQTSLHRIDGTRVAMLEANELNEGHPYYPYLSDRAQVEFGTFSAASEDELYYRLIKPSDFDAGKKYPVLVFVYGGPGAQLVRKAWPGQRAQWLEVVANEGYLVFTVDNRGSENRGKAFEDPIYRRMGRIEVEDQMRGVEFLNGLAYADTDRVGIFGWSYGGFMTLMSMMAAPDMFRAGVAVSPVVDWRLYDTHYTERYLGDPRVNADGYTASSPITYVDNLKRPLLLMHGLADNNVIPQNSTVLAKALQDKDIPFEMMFYPAKRHGIRGNETRRHLFKSVIRFLERNLKAPVE